MESIQENGHHTSVYLTPVTTDDARKIWQDVILKIRAKEASFVMWPQLRDSLNADLREYVQNLTRGLTKGLIDFAAYSPTDGVVVLSPRAKVPNADFIVVFKADGDEDGFEYFGIRKDSAGPVETSKMQVKLGFVEATI